MWQRFTERARRVVFFAQEEAGRAGENYVHPEHLLLGLLREEDTVAARILHRMEVSLTQMRSEIERQIPRGEGRLGQDMQLTPRSKRVIDLSYDEARQLDNNYIGTEHLLLGLIREGGDLIGSVMSQLGVDLERTQIETQKLQGEQPKNNEHLKNKENILKPIGVSETQAIGDYGIARSNNGRETVEVCLDAPAFVQLTAVYAAKDTHGYRAMANGDQTMFLVPVGTPLKLLGTPPESGAATAQSGGSYVRVLSGPYTGYAGWIFKAAFERTGADEGEFPPRDEL